MRSGLTSAFLHVRELGRVAHIAGLTAGPVHVGTLAALPVLGAEQAPRLVRRRLANFGAQLLLAGAATAAAAPVAAVSIPFPIPLWLITAITVAIAFVALRPAGKIEMATAAKSGKGEIRCTARPARLLREVAAVPASISLHSLEIRANPIARGSDASATSAPHCCASVRAGHL